MPNIKETFTVKQNGQAMTEFAVVASFVLVPLFLLVPILGKHIDIKHKTIQAARYEAWEFTAWNKDNTSARFEGYKKSIPVKKIGDLKLETNNRFYTETGRAIKSSDDQAWLPSKVNPLWKDHKDNDLLKRPDENNQVNESNTPDSTGIISYFINGVGKVSNLLSKALGFIGVDAGFTQIDATGNFTGKSVSRIESLDWIDPDNVLDTDSFEDGLTFTHQAAVMSEAWSAGGKDHTTYQVRGLVPTAILDIKALNAARNILSKVLIMPELHADWLKFGYISPDAVPADRLIAQGQTNPGKVVCNEKLLSYRYSRPGKNDSLGIFSPGTAKEIKSTTTLSGRTKKFGTCASIN